MPQLTVVEKRAGEAILNKKLEDYRRQHPHWQQEPALKKIVLLACVCCWQNLALLAGIILIFGVLLLIIQPNLTFFGAGFVGITGLVEGIFLYVGCQDSQRLTVAVTQLCAPQSVFAVESLRNKNLRAKLYQALQYWSLIEQMQHRPPQGILPDHLARTTLEMTQWLYMVYHLTGWVDKYRCNVTLQRDLHHLPQVIQSYEQKLNQEPNRELRNQLQQTLAYKQQQLQILNELQGHIEKALYQLDNTIASMGLVYSQLLLLTSSKDVERGRINRLQTEITEEVRRLEDLTMVMNEVYHFSLNS